MSITVRYRTRRLSIIKTTLVILIILIFVLQVLQYYFQVNYGAVPAFILSKITSTKNVPINELMTEDRRPFYAYRNNSRETFISGFHRHNCGCNKYDSLPHGASIDIKDDSSTCSEEATIYGKGQKVISYSLYVENSEGTTFFLDGIKPNLEKIKKLFPGWVVRIYSNIPINHYSCYFICKYNFLFWCDITKIPRLGNLSDMNGRVWRYLVVGDPTVDVFLSRDLDSTASERERLSVTEFENSDKAIHVIRDSHWHETEVLAGLWGLKNTALPAKDLKYLQNTIIKVGDRSQSKFWDQEIVENYIYSPYQDKVMAHDSYFCGKYPDGEIRPFPIQRIGQEFVGHDDRKEMNRFMVGKLKVCPIECRPPQGKDWTYC